MTSKRSSVILTISLLINLAAFVSACAGRSPLTGLPIWRGVLWDGNPDIAAVARPKDIPPRAISCSDARFDNMVCMSYEDFGCMNFAFVQNCRDWVTLDPGCPKGLNKEEVKKWVGFYQDGVKAGLVGTDKPKVSRSKK